MKKKWGKESRSKQGGNQGTTGDGRGDFNKDSRKEKTSDVAQFQGDITKSV